METFVLTFADFPAELHLLIAEYCNPEDIIAIICTNKSFNAIYSSLLSDMMSIWNGSVFSLSKICAHHNRLIFGRININSMNDVNILKGLNITQGNIVINSFSAGESHIRARKGIIEIEQKTDLTGHIANVLRETLKILSNGINKRVRVYAICPVPIRKVIAGRQILKFIADGTKVISVGPNPSSTLKLNDQYFRVVKFDFILDEKAIVSNSSEYIAIPLSECVIYEFMKMASNVSFVSKDLIRPALKEIRSRISSMYSGHVVTSNSFSMTFSPITFNTKRWNSDYKRDLFMSQLNGFSNYDTTMNSKLIEIYGFKFVLFNGDYILDHIPEISVIKTSQEMNVLIDKSFEAKIVKRTITFDKARLSTSRGRKSKNGDSYSTKEVRSIASSMGIKHVRKTKSQVIDMIMALSDK